MERKYTLSLAPDDLEKMIGLLNQAREADPGCPLAYLGLGDAFQHRFAYEGRDPESLRLMTENYHRAYEMAPERAETNVGVGWIHFFRRDNNQAFGYFKKALGLDPTNLQVLMDVGSFLRSIGILERSVEYYSRVIQAGGPTTDILMLRAWSYECLGLYESALADIDKITELEPSDFLIRLLSSAVAPLDEAHGSCGGRAVHGRYSRPGRRSRRRRPRAYRGGQGGPEGSAGIIAAVWDPATGR